MLQAKTQTIELEVCDFCGGVFLKGQAPEECKKGWPERRFQTGEEIITSFGLYAEGQRVRVIDARGVVDGHFSPTKPVPELEFSQCTDMFGKTIVSKLPRADHRWLVRVGPLVAERDKGTLRAFVATEASIVTREATLITRVRCVLNIVTIEGGKFGSRERNLALVEGKDYPLTQPIAKWSEVVRYRLCDEQGVEGGFPTYLFEIAEEIPDPSIQ